MRNIIDAIITLVKQNETALTNNQIGNNRANIAGYALEDYVKNLFADTFECSEIERKRQWQQVFSYFGNDSNPPDLMLRDGDAIEVKKIQSDNAALALNSSYPKHTLLKTNPMITNECREAEEWTEKDMIYAVGVVKNNKLKHLCMVYGRNYCASNICYDRIRQHIKSGIENIDDVEFAQTNELGRINLVDPLGITYLRVRGMWHIKNPWKVFDYIYERDMNANFNFMCLIDFVKWNQLNNRDNFLEFQKDYHNLKISDVKIKNPNYPSSLDEAKLIQYRF